MKFLIQKVNGKIAHDFTFTLLKAVEFHSWFSGKNNAIKVKYVNTIYNEKLDVFAPVEFKPFHKNYVPIGSVEFVSEFLLLFYNHTPKPKNVPPELMLPCYTQRVIFNGNHMDLEDRKGVWFIKSNEKIKGYSNLCDFNHFKFNEDFPDIPPGNYQISEYVEIGSEWRAFVYKDKLVGLQNYSGDFTLFPNIEKINAMIGAYAYAPAPIVYTLDIGVKRINEYSSHTSTFVIEVHDFFSCGLYGFSDLNLLPHMFHRWFNEYLKRYGHD
ncbi:MAG: ATP-grasp domain-containing protein [Dehalococcoidia bacterium]|jgi:hypothetical protein